MARNRPARGEIVTLKVPADWPEGEVPVQAGTGDRARLIPPMATLAELRGRGPVSAAIANLCEDMTLDRRRLFDAKSRVKAEALAKVGEFAIQVGRHEAVVSDVHVDAHGALVCTITHPAIPEEANPFRFVNPPPSVPSGLFTTETNLATGETRDIEGSREDLRAAFRQIVRDAVEAVVR